MHHPDTNSDAAHRNALHAWRLFTIASIVATACVMVAIIAILAGWHHAAKHRETAESATQDATDTKLLVERLEGENARLAQDLEAMRTTSAGIQRDQIEARNESETADRKIAELRRGIEAPHELPAGNLEDLVQRGDLSIVVSVQNPPSQPDLLPEPSLQKFAEQAAIDLGWVLEPFDPDGPRPVVRIQVHSSELGGDDWLLTVQVDLQTKIVTRTGKGHLMVPVLSEVASTLAGTTNVSNQARTFIKGLLEGIDDSLPEEIPPVDDTSQTLP